MSLWFAGAFDDAPYRPNSSKRMTSQHPNAQTGGSHFWFGAEGKTNYHNNNDNNNTSATDAAGVDRRRARSAGPTFNERPGKRQAPSEILAVQQNVGFGGVVDNSSIHKNNNDSTTTPHRGAGSRFHTPHRVQAEERGYSINPITLMPMTHGPSQVSQEAFQRFQSDVQRRDFFAASTDTHNNLRGVRSPQAIVAMAEQQNAQERRAAEQQRQQSAPRSQHVDPSATNFSSSAITSPNQEQQQQPPTRHSHSVYNAPIAPDAFGFCRSASAGATTTARRYQYQRQREEEQLLEGRTSSSRYGGGGGRASSVGPSTSTFVMHNTHSAASRGGNNNNNNAAPSPPRNHHHDSNNSHHYHYDDNNNNNNNNRFAEQYNNQMAASSFAALNQARTVLYADHSKQEDVFMKGGRRALIDIPSAHERPPTPSYAARMYPSKVDRGVPYDTMVAVPMRGGGGNTDGSATNVDSAYYTHHQQQHASGEGYTDGDAILRTQKKMVPVPEGRYNIGDEDRFLLKTSRMAPADKTERSTKEGFAVLLSTDPSRQRNPLDGMRMLEKPGKVTSNFVKRTREERLGREQQLMLERREKCQRAFEAERLRMATRKTHDESFMAAKGRLHTPVATTRGPYALEMPAPGMATVGKPTPWWQR